MVFISLLEGSMGIHRFQDFDCLWFWHFFVGGCPCRSRGNNPTLLCISVVDSGLDECMQSFQGILVSVFWGRPQRVTTSRHP